MAIPILIYGKSGSGKSRYLKNFKSDEITFINCNYKDLPIKNQFKYRLDSDNSAEVLAAVKGSPTDIIVADKHIFRRAFQAKIRRFYFRFVQPDRG